MSLILSGEKKKKDEKENVELVNIQLSVGWRWMAKQGHTGCWHRGRIFFPPKGIQPKFELFSTWSKMMLCEGVMCIFVKP